MIRHLSECMMIHRNLLFGRGGAFSWITMPYLFFFEWLAPLVVLFGLGFLVVCACLGFLDWVSQLWLAGLVFVLALMGSVAAILLDELSYTSYRMSSIWVLFVDALFENVGYRQFVLIANFMGLMEFLLRRPLRGNRTPPGLFVEAWRPLNRPNG